MSCGLQVHITGPRWQGLMLGTRLLGHVPQRVSIPTEEAVGIDVSETTSDWSVQHPMWHSLHPLPYLVARAYGSLFHIFRHTDPVESG